MIVIVTRVHRVRHAPELGNSPPREDEKTAQVSSTTHAADGLGEYRDFLQTAYKDQSDAYDKAVMTLSGGALGVSMTFIKDLVPTPISATLWLLGSAWASFGVSVLAILISMFTSQLAIKKAMKQVDAGTIRTERPGKWYGRVTASLNVLAGLGFAVGVMFLVWFALQNLGSVTAPHKAS